ncbi:MAG: hypothetical protein C0497_02820 [Gemmatimonas sp.]|nr:hypothetical protein [Gemmatimonas sp.]
MTVGPLSAGALGAGVIRRYPRRFGWVFGAYTMLAVALAIAPFVLAGAADAPRAVLEPVLRQAKFAVTLGAFVLLDAAGLWSRRTRPPAL